MEKITKKTGFLLATGVAVTIALTAGITSLNIEYAEQEDIVSDLQFNAEMIAGGTNWYDPAAGLWVDGKVDKELVAAMVAKEQFPRDDVFNTPEWEAYEELTRQRNSDYQQETLKTHRQEVESLTFPDLQEEAEQAYRVIEVSVSQQTSPYKETIIFEAGRILSSSNTKEEALQKASGWDFVIEHANGTETLLTDEFLNTFWGIEDANEENRKIARDAIRKAIHEAIADDYVGF